MTTTTMNTIFATWQDGDISDTEALRALCRDLGAVESQLAPLAAEKATLRTQIGQIVARLDGEKTTIPGVGTLRITAPAVTPSYDRAALDAIVLALVATHPAIAAQISTCRRESVRAGSLRIEPAKKG